MTHELFSTRDYAALKEALKSMNIVDIAEELEELDARGAITVFRMLPKDLAADVFAYLSRDKQQDIVSAIKDHEIQDIIDDLFLDDAVDFIEEMPANVVKRVLSNLPADKRELINHFLMYPEGSAGSIMTIEYVDLKESFTVHDTFEYIRQCGVDKETIYTSYVINSERKLIGTVSVRTLLLSDPTSKITDIMEKSIISATTSDDIEVLTNDFRKYGLLAMPIVDQENRLVGIVTVDDVLDAQEEAATEDFEIMAAISPSDEPYLKASVPSLTKNRILWLMLLMLSATVTGSIIASFEEALSALPVLMTFIPMLMDTGGNSGSQSSTMIIRGMAINEIKLGDVGHVLWKELRIALLCGTALAMVNFLRIWILNRDPLLGLTVSIALFSTVILAKTVGCLLPMGAKKLKLDPAVMASPVITTIVDAGALVIYITISKVLLGHLM